MSLDATTMEATPASQASQEPAIEMRRLALTAIVPSKTNRTRFDEEKLQQLADNIKASDVHQPILVRPLPASRLQETFEDRSKGAPLPGFEIIAGERRYRASKMAGKTDIPAIVRHLDDAEVLELQIVENLQREDLHPMEEAEGYERLMQTSGLNADGIAAKVGKSRSYVYGRLKLLELRKEGRDAFYEGKFDASIALLIARIPDHKLQIRAVKDITRSMGSGSTMSYRDAVDWVQQNVMLKLSTAKFKIDDAGLVKEAGSCKVCPKRTGANPDLFSDVQSADVCTDITCFQKKQVAHEAAIVVKAKEKGQTVIDGKQAKELMPNNWGEPKGYMRLDEKNYHNGRYSSLRSAIGKENLPTPVLFMNPHTDKVEEIIPASVASRLLSKTKETKELEKQAEASTDSQLEDKFDKQWPEAVIAAAHGALMAGKMKAMSVAFARQIALSHSREIYSHEDQLCELFGVGKVAKNAGIEDFVKTCSADQVAPVMLLLMLAEEFECSYHGSATPVRDLLAKELGLDVKAIEQRVRSDIRAAEAERIAKAKAKQEEKAAKAAKKAPAATSPAAPAGVPPKGTAAKAAATKEPAAPAGKPAAGAKKASAEEVKSGIAEAMQSAQPAVPFRVGDEILVKVDIKGAGGKLQKVAGKPGKVLKAIGDRAYEVDLGKAGTVTADYTELELTQRVAQPTDAWPFPDTKAAKKAIEAEAKRLGPPAAAAVPAKAPAKKTASKDAK